MCWVYRVGVVAGWDVPGGAGDDGWPGVGVTDGDEGLGLGLGDADRVGVAGWPVCVVVGEGLCLGDRGALGVAVEPDVCAAGLVGAGTGRTSRYRASTPRKSPDSTMVEVRGRLLMSHLRWPGPC